MSGDFKVAGVFSAMEVAASGLSAERGRMNIIASNLANARTTRGANGQPYVRQDPVFQAQQVAPAAFDPILRQLNEVRMTGTRPDPTPGQLVYEPGHPDANPQGYVAYPNIDPAEETVDMLSAIRSYEASTNVVKTMQRMTDSALSIIR